MAERGREAKRGDKSKEKLNDKLRQFLGPVIARTASEEDVNQAAAKVEEEAATDPAFRERSLLVLKPTGGVDHEGGTRFSEDSPEAAVLRQWIAAGEQRNKLEQEEESIGTFGSLSIVTPTGASLTEMEFEAKSGARCDPCRGHHDSEGVCFRWCRFAQPPAIC